MSAAALRIVSAGPGVTLQDAGRFGYMRFGVTPAGPMDPLSFASANRAVGRPPGSPAIEISLGGAEFSAEGEPLIVAIAGGDFKISLDGKPLPAAVLLALEPRQRLTIKPGPAGSWCYLAVAGEIDIPVALGSLATHTRSNIGGFKGRALVADDVLPIRSAAMREATAAAVDVPWLERPGNTIRVVAGPQNDYFSGDQFDAFLAGPWKISGRSDRMAYLLEGPKLTHEKGFNIVSDGVAMGAIQVPGDGQPVVLMADRQPTGGYPKIANLIRADMGKLAQLRPGTEIRFSAVTLGQAVEALRAEHATLELPIDLKPIFRSDLSSEFLLGLNLVGGVTRADNE